MQANSTAILIFSRNAQEEFRYKSWGLNFVRFSQVHKALINQTRETAIQSGLPVFEADSTIQQGPDFGSRLVSAIDWVNAKGYTKMIILGNDSPGLTKAQLVDSAKLLEKGRSVLGKDSHGGSYLIALNTAQLNRTAFSNIDWQTNRVFEQLYSCLNQVVVLKEAQIDINNKADLQYLSVTAKTIKHFVRMIWALVFGGLAKVGDLKWIPLTIFSTASPHRGPPAMA